jgi:hypothetical protein
LLAQYSTGNVSGFVFLKYHGLFALPITKGVICSPVILAHKVLQLFFLLIFSPRYNVPSHPKINFDSVKVAFFRPNVTSKSQSMDQGIIQATKLKFRKRQLQFMLSQMDKGESKTGTQILKDISSLFHQFDIAP